MPTLRRMSRARANRQRGDILLVTLVFLMVFLLGLVVSTRESAVTTLATGNNLARQKNVQIADVALRQLETLIQATSSNGNGSALADSASGQPWWRPVAGVAPAANYWDNCLGNGDPSLRCGAVPISVNGQALPYTAYAVVQPAGRSKPDTQSCGAKNYIATYYDVFIYVKESSGATAANTETVYRLCTKQNLTSS